jgi:hypothetical protein
MHIIKKNCTLCHNTVFLIWLYLMFLTWIRLITNIPTALALFIANCVIKSEEVLVFFNSLRSPSTEKGTMPGILARHSCSCTSQIAVTLISRAGKDFWVTRGQCRQVACFHPGPRETNSCVFGRSWLNSRESPMDISTFGRNSRRVLRPS